MAQPSFTPFTGFPDDSSEYVHLPATFFTQVLNRINDLGQLRLLLYLFWHAEQQQEKVSYFRWDDFSADPALVEMMGDEHGLLQALEGLLGLNVVIKAEIDWMDEVYYFLNTTQGRAAVQAIEQGTWLGNQPERQPIHLPENPPNIFQLYEENIGVITPMMAEILKDDEATYPPAWIKEAIQIAVARNIRTWKYVQAILQRWHKEGRTDEQNRRDDSQDPERYRKSWLRHD